MGVLKNPRMEDGDDKWLKYCDCVKLLRYKSVVFEKNIWTKVILPLYDLFKKAYSTALMYNVPNGHNFSINFVMVMVMVVYLRVH